MKLDTEKALKNIVVMLSGDEDGLRRRFLADLVNAASGGDEFDLESFFGDSSTPAAWLASAGTAPFLSPRRTVVVRNLCRSDDWEHLNALSLPETALVLLVADEEAGDESKQRRMTAHRGQWEKAVKAAGGLIVNCHVDSKQLREDIKSEAEKAGKKMPDRASDLLIEMCGANLTRSLEELEKLILFAGDREVISETDVKHVVMPSREWNVFKLIDAIVGGDAAGALRQLRILVGGTSKTEDTAYRSILPLLSRQLRLLWQARICVEMRCDPADQAVKQYMVGKPNLSTEKEFVARKAMQAAQKLDFAGLTTCLQALSDADARLKGLEEGFSGLDTLERMVLEMIRAVRKAA